MVNVKSTYALAFATKILARCNSSFKGTIECGSIILPIPDPLLTNTILRNGIYEYLLALLTNIISWTISYQSFVDKFYAPPAINVIHFLFELLQNQYRKKQLYEKEIHVESKESY